MTTLTDQQSRALLDFALTQVQHLLPDPLPNLEHAPPEPTRPAVWPFKNYPGKAAHEVPYSEPPTFRPPDEDEALL